MKRGRENPCFICGHYHKFEEGEVCSICGHRKAEPELTLGWQGPAGAASGGPQFSAFPTEIIPEFLFLGTYDNASRSELLKAQGISHILNAVPTCSNLYRTSFTYFSMPEAQSIPFDDCCDFIEQARTNGARVLVHCMSGQSRSPSIVVAYLMRHQGHSLEDAVREVKLKRPSVNITQALLEQLLEFQSKLHQGKPLQTVPALPLPYSTTTGGLRFDHPSLESSANASEPAALPTFLGETGAAPFNFQASFGAGSTQPSFVFGSGAHSQSPK